MPQAYATVEQLKALLGMEKGLRDDALSLWLNGASRLVDRYCKRHFYQETATREYRAGYPITFTGDFVSLSTVAVVEDWSTPTALTLGQNVEPWGGGAADRPYLGIRHADDWHNLGAKIRITAVWGWPEIPADITAATLRLAGAMYRQAQAGFSEAVATGELGTVQITRMIDYGSRLMLEQYRRMVLA